MATKTQDIDIKQDVTADEMGTAIVPVEEEQSLVPATTQSWGKQPEFDQSDIFLPMLKLAQATTREVQAGDAKQGEWVVQGYPSIKNPTVVPLSAEKRYRRIAKLPAKPVACWNHVAEADEDCPNCRWQYEKALQSGDFESSLVTAYHYDLYVKELASPAILELAGTAASAAKVLNAKIMGRGIGNLAVRLGSTLSENDKGRWYSPVIQELPERDEQLLAEARALATA